MAEIVSSPSLGGGTLPANAGDLIREPDWGIDATLSGYIIQNLTINNSRITDETQDQKGATVSELDYDERWDCSFTAIGGDGTEGTPAPLQPGQIDFTFANHKWKVDSCNYTGTYNGKKSYQVNMHRFKNFPPES